MKRQSVGEMIPFGKGITFSSPWVNELYADRILIHPPRVKWLEGCKGTLLMMIHCLRINPIVHTATYSYVSAALPGVMEMIKRGESMEEGGRDGDAAPSACACPPFSLVPATLHL